MKNSNEDVIDFIKDRKINNVIRLYVNRNLRKEYLTYVGYKKVKNDFEAILVQKDNRIGTLLCDFLNCNFRATDSVKNFVQEYSLTLFSEIIKNELKNIYDTDEYEKLISELVEKYGDKLESIKEDFIYDVNYLFNINQLEEIKDLTSLQIFYILTMSKTNSKALSHFENDKLDIALGDLSRLNAPLNIIDEDQAIEMVKVNKDRILPIPYTFESNDICQLLIIELQEIVCMDKFEIKKCKNCGKYFVPEKRTDELYCNNVYEDGRTCKEIGSFKVKQKMINDDNDLRTYRNVYQKLLLRTRRNPDNIQYEKEFEKFKEDNREMRDKLDKGKVTYEEYVEWLNGI
ncbi:putative uncharacterized protein [Clostridium sp. CAG:571]|nr:putative uncharacterized protein [Clostridium sp. CAG:571]